MTAGVPVFHPESNTVDYTFEVERGPVVDISAEGMQLSRGKLKRYVPVYEEHAVDEDLLNEGRRNLRDYLQGQGYFDAMVQVRQDEDAEHDRRAHCVLDPTRPAAPAARHRNGGATSVLTRQPCASAWGRRFPACCSRTGATARRSWRIDLQAIKNLYLANGYQSVKVTSEVHGRLRRTLAAT